jgi:hypothetical protein
VTAWRGVDLDGTLAMYEGWRGADHIGPPVPKMVERVKRWLAAGDEVRIVTARLSGLTPKEFFAARRAIQDWCVEHLGQKLAVTNEKDFGMIELWDDRAVQVIPNTGERADGKDD